MVNFKASGHAGEHKRALAAQTTEHKAVSKAEKLAWSQKEGMLAAVPADAVVLRVVCREKVLQENNALVKAALVHESAITKLGAAGAALSGSGAPLVSRPGGDFVLSARAHAAAAEDEILLSEAQRLSLHVCEGEAYEWRPFGAGAGPSDGGGGAAPALAEVAAEVQLLQPVAGRAHVDLDATQLGRAAAKWLFGEVLSANELFIVSYESVALVLRVIEVALPTAEGAGDDDAVSDAHCFRGVVNARTEVYVSASTSYKTSDAQLAMAKQLRLGSVRARPPRPPRNELLVTTSDGEVFPVLKPLLKPCIALTKAVRQAEGDGPAEASVPVECAIFDRVLLFLEAHARGNAEAFAFDISSLEQMGQAAGALGCRVLRECCEKRLGDFESRIRMHRWADVTKQNDSGGCWVTMDGMVFDLEAWLPEHPGGSTIIPQQALNKDCTVFFELYHASRESFTYLREFYIGELWPDERALVPLEDERASDDFMVQLREYSAPFRYSPDTTTAHKSF